MNLAIPLLMIAMVGIMIPAYAQNVSQEEVDVKVRELIKECQEEVKNDENLSAAEKTVAQRDCETRITNEYKNVEIDYQNLDEERARLQTIQSCEDWHPQYRYLTEAQFRLQKHSQTVDDCILLYHDAIWEYVGEDRLKKLSERLIEIKSELPAEPETREVNLDVNIPKFESNQILDKNSEDIDLEEKVRLLEEEIAKKDEIIREQVKVIMELANRVKNIMFDPFESFFIKFQI